MSDARAVAPIISTILMVTVAVIVAATVAVFALQLGEDVSEKGPNAVVEIETNYLNDGVDKNDSVTITHIAGDELDRERLEVTIGDELVYNETDDSETTNPSFAVPGLIVEVNDGDEFNDLNKPCFVDRQRVSPTGTCGGPPGDSDGSDRGVGLEWAEDVNAGERIVIQERNAAKAVDVIQPGDEITVVYRGEEFTAILAQETIPEE